MITADSILINIETLTYKEVVSVKDEKTAVLCAQALVNCLYLNFKNRLMYIPSTHANNSNDIYSSVYKDFNGHNHQELAIKYNRSAQNIYSIIKREMQNHIRKNQNDIFFEEIKEEEKRPITMLVLEDYLPSEFVRCGLEKLQAKKISKKISTHICETYPGVSIYISEAIKNKRTQKNQTNIFNL